MINIVSSLYNISRKTGKVASIANDIKTISSCSTSKICKRLVRKTVNKTGNRMIRQINRRFK